MKTTLQLTIFSCLVFSACQPEKLSTMVKTEIINIATRFSSSKLDSFTVVTDDNGIVKIADEQAVRYIIDPHNIFQDIIDEKAGTDYLVTIDSLHDPYIMPAWHLILTKGRNEMKTVSVIRSDMRVLSVKNGIITAVIPTHKPASPLYYCSECRDTVNYKVINGALTLQE
ncbi:MAG TPA: hypothetical protein VHI78_07790 [Bacteroidales bacterium]|nr:hypothetical protein [Bacteroidales bacterium]